MLLLGGDLGFTTHRLVAAWLDLSGEDHAVGLSRDRLQSCRYHIIFILYKSLGLERFVTLAILHLLVGQGDIFNCFLLITKFFHLLFKSFVHLLAAFLFES